METQTDEKNVKAHLRDTHWIKIIVLMLEIFFFIISLIVFIISITYPANNDKLNQSAIIAWNVGSGISSNCFTALLVTLIVTIVNWRSQTEAERLAKDLAEKDRQIDEKQSGIIKDLSNEVARLSNACEVYNGKACVFCSNYIRGVKNNRSECNLREFFLSAKREISILMTNLSSIKDYETELDNIAENPDIKVRILTMHPDLALDFNISRMIKYEDNEPSLRSRWEKMRLSAECFAKENANYEFRTYKGIDPTLILFIVDDSCYVAHLLNGRRSSKTTHFLFGDSAVGSNGVGVSPVKYFKEHFDLAWNDVNTVRCTSEEIHDLQYNEARERELLDARGLIQNV